MNMNINDLIWRIQDDIVDVVGGTDGSKAEDLSLLKTLSFDELIQRFVHGIISLAVNITIAIIVFYIGKFIINKIYSVVGNVLLKRQVDSSLMTFILSFVKIVLYFILIVTVIGILGIETTSFLALFASAGVAIGMALSGTLQNFAGGVMILLLKPYKVNDFIEAQGFSGIVKEIQIFHTIIVTVDNKRISIPNGPLSTDAINNWNREEARRVEWTVGISYGDSVATARDVIMDILNSDSRILHPDRKNAETAQGTEPTEATEATEVADTAEAAEAAEAETVDADSTKIVGQTVDSTEIADTAESDTAESAETETEVAESAETETETAEPGERHSVIYNFFMRRKQRNRERQEYIRKQVESKMPNPIKEPVVVVADLADSAVVLKVRAWVATQDYWDVFYELYEKIYTKLPESGVSFPFPQLDVHFDNTQSSEK